ncbi:DUF1134 domain-containing protein [Microbaculum marinum]|uniref:DUF1134 domain-containing protein n=1 Tax=Microbaculum marinum TaxID=1764581 RepID=A0AAW9RQF2_9HYPH
MKETRRSVLVGLAATAGGSLLPTRLPAQTAGQPGTYTTDEIIEAGHGFFGQLSQGLAEAIESLFSSQGRPNGYILGEEGGGAFVAGLRYGEGVLNTKNVGQHKVFWQGPSIGWDFGGDGARTMMLVYNLPDVEAIYRHFVGLNGSAYLVAGFGVSLYSNHEILVAPIRSGLGARLGVNIGYLKMTRKATWNPF